MARVNDTERLAEIKAELDRDIIPPMEYERVRPYRDDPLGHQNELITVAQVNDAMRLWAKRINIARESLSPTEVLKRLLVLRAWRNTLLSDPVGKWAARIAKMEREHKADMVYLKGLCNQKILRARVSIEKKYRKKMEEALAGIRPADDESPDDEGETGEEFDLEEDEEVST